MSTRLVALDKGPVTSPVGIGKIFRRLWAKVTLEVCGERATMDCGDLNLCAGLPAGIEGAIHAVQPIGARMSAQMDMRVETVQADRASHGGTGSAEAAENTPADRASHGVTGSVEVVEGGSGSIVMGDDPASKRHSPAVSAPSPTGRTVLPGPTVPEGVPPRQCGGCTVTSHSDATRCNLRITVRGRSCTTISPTSASTTDPTGGEKTGMKRLQSDGGGSGMEQAFQGLTCNDTEGLEEQVEGLLTQPETVCKTRGRTSGRSHRRTTE